MGASSSLSLLETISQIMVCIALFHNTLILAYHISQTTITLKNDNETTISRVLCISILCIFLMILSNITNILSTFALIPTTIINCQLQINIQLFTYIYSKISLYILFLERLFTVFINSDLQFTKSQIYSSRTYLFLLLSFYTIMVIIFSNGTYNSFVNGCSFNHPAWLNIIAAICDCTTISVILILFSRRLWILTHRIIGMNNSHMIKMHHISNNESNSNVSISTTAITTNNTPKNTPTNCKLHLASVESESVESCTVQQVNVSNNGYPSCLQSISLRLAKLVKWNADEMLLSVLRKITILNIVAVISTLFTMLFCCFIFPTLWISIDTIIECWSILLMFKWYNNIYLFCCGKISNKLSDECLSCCSCHCFCSVITSSMDNDDINIIKKLSNESISGIIIYTNNYIG
eukprot:34086_1